MASSSTRSPRLMRPSATAVASARGTEAAEVLPCRATVETTFCGVDVQLLGRAVEDSLIGLVGHEPVDFRHGNARRLRRGLDRCRDIGHGVAEDLLALHAQIAGGLRGRRAAVHIKQVVQPAVGKQLGVEHAAIGGRRPRPRPALSTTAPAPSPNSTQVRRSFQSISRDMRLGADDQHRSRLAGAMKLSATASA